MAFCPDQLSFSQEIFVFRCYSCYPLYNVVTSFERHSVDYSTRKATSTNQHSVQRNLPKRRRSGAQRRLACCPKEVELSSRRKCKPILIDFYSLPFRFVIFTIVATICWNRNATELLWLQESRLLWTWNLNALARNTANDRSKICTSFISMWFRWKCPIDLGLLKKFE